MIKRKSVLSVTAGLLCLGGFAYVPAHAATYPMRQVRIELNGQTLSTPSGFTYQVQNTTYMPLYYVQQLLNHLKLTNTWSGAGSNQTWAVHSFYLKSPVGILDQKSGSITISVNSKQIATHVDKIAAVDPASHQYTTYVPIWFIEQTLLALGMQSTWNGTTWNVETNYTDYAKDGTYLGSVSTLSDAKTALALYPLGYVEDSHGSTVFVQPSCLNVDLRFPAPANVTADSINKYLAAQHSPLTGLGQSFINAGNTYGVNANFLVAVASNESTFGTSELALMKNNLFGYGAFDASATADSGIFPSDDYAIQFEAFELRNHYLNPGADEYDSANGPTLAGVGEAYASDSQWAVKTGQLMYQFATSLGNSVTSYKQYQSGEVAPDPESTSEPVYKLNGATGMVEADLNYPAPPVYPDASTGAAHMFVRTLSQNDQGPDVKTLQNALNVQENAGLTVDGVFGANTVQAVGTYQKAHGQSPTGTVDFDLWNNLLNLSAAEGQLSIGQSVTIDGMVQGMAGGLVTEWYHLTQGGYVNANDLQLTNVYKITVPNTTSPGDVSVPVSVSVSSSSSSSATGSSSPVTLHAGDYVVSNNPVPQNGLIQIQFVHPSAGPLTGNVNANAASLTKVLK
jgi:mannosyl-glycoprotein endo-beta-N-acetylglucosaminidase